MNSVRDNTFSLPYFFKSQNFHNYLAGILLLLEQMVAHAFSHTLSPTPFPPHALCSVCLETIFHSYVGCTKISAPKSLMNASLNILEKILYADVDCKSDEIPP